MPRPGWPMPRRYGDVMPVAIRVIPCLDVDAGRFHVPQNLGHLGLGHATASPAHHRNHDRIVRLRAVARGCGDRKRHAV